MNRQEYPLQNGQYYNGGQNDTKQGEERVVYYYTGEVDFEGHPEAHYCGIVTHVGAPTGGYVAC